jgi:polyisoprenoid-binding protein YceI
MPKWTFEPGHTAAEFCVRHMMITNVRGHFKNVHGTLEFDPDNPQNSTVEVTIDAKAQRGLSGCRKPPRNNI